MEFRVLGPVGLWCRQNPVGFGGPKPRAVLAALLLADGHPVSRERLIDLVWDETPPPRAGDVIRQYIAALRRGLRRCNRQELLVTEAGGYALRIQPDDLDLAVFHRIAERGRRAAGAGQWKRAATDFREALALWRGPALDGCSLAGGRVATHLEEQRIRVLDERIEVDLILGDHAALVPELTRLLDETPLNERLHARLMTALCQLGRSAEALLSYQRVDALLRATLGVGPGPELRAIHDAVVRVPTSTAPPPTSRPRETLALLPPWHPVPRQLPSDLPDLVAVERRTAEVAQRLRRTDHTSVPVVVVSGPGGVGKTTLAVHVAHQVRHDFPDGQLYLDLRGGSTRPMPATEALGRFLTALGMREPAIGDTLDERAEQFRTRTAGRRILVVLDDAASAAQVRPLLPGEPTCAVIITSRAILADLPGATETALDMLSTEQAVSMLRGIVGAARVDAEPAAAEQVVRLCGQLPLAVLVAGTRLAGRPDRSLAWLAGRLGHERHRLTELRAGNLEVRATIATGYRSLPKAGRRALRILTCLDGEFPGWVAEPLLGVPSEAAETLLDGLVRTRLLVVAGVDQFGQTRYRFHDLVRLYGRELAESVDPLAERTAAVTRLTRACLQLAQAACRSRSPAGAPVPAGTSHGSDIPGALPIGQVVTNSAAWFNNEDSTLVNVVELAASHGLVVLAGELTETLTAAHFAAGNHFASWRRTHLATLEAARRTRHCRAQARMQIGLGTLSQEQGHYVEAHELFQDALRVAEANGDVVERARVDYGLGVLRREVGDLPAALDHLTRASGVLVRHGGSETDAAKARYHLACIRLEQGDLAGAAHGLAEVLGVFRAGGARRAEAIATRSLGLVRRADGSWAAAAELCQRAHRLMIDIGDALLAAYGAQALAKVRLRMGQADEAESLLTDATATCLDLKDQFGTALMHRTWGELCLSVGRIAEARNHLDRALTGWQHLGLRQWRARTLRDLGVVALRDSPSHATAHEIWLDAAGIFGELGMREADELGSWRAAAGCGCPLPRADAPRTVEDRAGTDGGRRASTLSVRSAAGPQSSAPLPQESW